MTELDDLVAIKAGAVNAAGTREAIAKIEAKITDYQERAVARRAARKKSLLQLAADKLLGMENEARVLEIAAEQATEILEALQGLLKTQEAVEANEVLEARRADILQRQKACAARFKERYGKVVAEMLAAIDDVAAVDYEVSQFNSEKRDYDRRYNSGAGRPVTLDGAKVLYLDTREEVPEPLGRPVQGLGPAVNPHLLARVCLPSPEFDGIAGDRVPMAYAGSFIAKIMQETALRHGPGMSVPAPDERGRGAVELDQAPARQQVSGSHGREGRQPYTPGPARPAA